MRKCFPYQEWLETPIEAGIDEWLAAAKVKSGVIFRASIEHASLICFPECFTPGYRALGKTVPPPDPAFLKCAWSAIAAAAAKATVAVVLGTERVADGVPLITALVINRDGTIAGFQDKVQLDPSEDDIYSPGYGRRVFQTGPLTFAVVICHEGWRYPETVRWAVRHGAQIVFHPHLSEAEPGGYGPSSFADPANSFHEKAALCRAAENTCYFATVNYASTGRRPLRRWCSPTERCSATSHTVKKGCSSQTSTSLRPQVSCLSGA